MGWILATFVFIVGACVGSFLNVVIHRLPAGQSLVRPGSRCPKCGHPIRWYDNIPIVSWLVLRGRCRDCKARISIRYPVVAAVTASLFLVLATLGPLSRSTSFEAVDYRGWVFFAIQAAFSACLVALFFVRYDRQIVSRPLIWLTLALGLALAFWGFGWPAL